MLALFSSALLRQVIVESSAKAASVKRWALVVSTISLSISLIIISCAYVVGASVAAEAIWAITIPLSIMAGASYTTVEVAKAKYGAAAATKKEAEPEELREDAGSPAGKQ